MVLADRIPKKAKTERSREQHAQHVDRPGGAAGAPVQAHITPVLSAQAAGGFFAGCRRLWWSGVTAVTPESNDPDRNLQCGTNRLRLVYEFLTSLVTGRWFPPLLKIYCSKVRRREIIRLFSTPSPGSRICSRLA